MATRPRTGYRLSGLARDWPGSVTHEYSKPTAIRHSNAMQPIALGSDRLRSAASTRDRAGFVLLVGSRLMFRSFLELQRVDPRFDPRPVLTFALTRGMTTMLVGVRPSDPITFVAMGVVFFVIAAVSSWLPARREAALDPTVALRE